LSIPKAIKKAALIIGGGGLIWHIADRFKPATTTRPQAPPVPRTAPQPPASPSLARADPNSPTGTT